MTELHTNGNYETYLSQLFNPLNPLNPLNPGNPLATGAQINPAGVGAIGGLGSAPNVAALLQNPWVTQNPSAMNALWAQQQVPNPAQSMQVVVLAQQIAARQAAQAIQYAQALQALQALQQLVQNLAAQQWTQSAMVLNPQAPFGHGVGGAFGFGQIGQGPGQLYNAGTQNLINQALYQLAQYLATQQPAQIRPS